MLSNIIIGVLVVLAISVVAVKFCNAAKNKGCICNANKAKQNTAKKSKPSSGCSGCDGCSN